ncbi:MAG: hypothetical protein L6Q75_07820 [Burkholderiaceae bacterium]|nr:hypothetical protein [Burkholderiaceae bacterium]
MSDPIDTAIRSLYDSVLDPTAWPDALGRVAVAFDAHAATVWRYDPQLHRISEMTAQGHDPAVLALYAAHYVQLDPATPKVLAAGVGQWLGDETLLDARQAAHRPYLYEFALPNGLGRVGGGQVAADGRGCLYLGVQRRPGSPRFGSVAAQRFASLAPHLARADAMRQHMARLEQQQALAANVLDRFETALCVVDAAGRILIANRAADPLFTTAGPLQVHGGFVRPRHDALRTWWPQALKAACGEPPRARATRLPGRDDGAAATVAWSLWLLPLPPGHALRDGRLEPRALLVGGRAGRAVRSPAHQAALREVYGLTPAEADWLTALAGGETAPAFAQRRGVSIHTVRSQTAALLGKLGCRSQLELAALARELPCLRGE